MMAEPLKRFLVLLSRIAISILSLGVVFYITRDRISEALTHLSAISWPPLFIALGLNFVSLVPVTLRLSRILAIQKVVIPFRRQYYLWMISLFFNLFLPSAVGGDIAKAYYLYKDSGKKMASVTSVLLDRFFGLTATVSIGFVAFLAIQKQIDDPKIGAILYWLAGFIFIAGLFVVSRRFSKPAKLFVLRFAPKGLQERIHRLFEALDLYRARKIDFLIGFGYSVLAQAIFIALVYFLAQSIHIRLSILHFFLLMPIVTLFSMIPSIGGLGVREAATIYLFRHFIALDQAIALSLLFDLFLYGVGGLCGILYAFKGGASIRELKRIEETGA